MKKINFKFIYILMFLILLTGCVKYDLNMEMQNDKSITIKITNAVEKSLYSEENIESTTDYEQLGYTIENYDDGNYKGITLLKKYDNIDMISSKDCGTVELTDLLTTNVNDVILFKSERSGTKTTYTGQFTYNLTETEDNENQETDYNQYANMMSFNYSISLPQNAEILNNNADEISNNKHTLNWKITYGEIKNINFSFTIDDNDIQNSTNTENDNSNSNENNEQNENEYSGNVTSTELEKENNNFSNYIIAILIVIVFVLSFIVLKIKGMKKLTNNNFNDNIQHNNPPDNIK